MFQRELVLTDDKNNEKKTTAHFLLCRFILKCYSLWDLFLPFVNSNIYNALKNIVSSCISLKKRITLCLNSSGLTVGGT